MGGMGGMGRLLLSVHGGLRPRFGLLWSAINYQEIVFFAPCTEIFTKIS
jgi:hypothetical protein